MRHGRVHPKVHGEKGRHLLKLMAGCRFDASVGKKEGGILFLTRSYDLAIIDLDVPEMNVWELSRIFRDHSPKTPVIMIIGFLEGKHWKNSDTNSVDAIIPKPFKLKDIEGTVRKLLYSETRGRRDTQNRFS
jgi:two-component system capsular synthesis sensor histidine kinase RcsC